LGQRALHIYIYLLFHLFIYMLIRVA
jgi:hypothetical protein